MQCRERPERQYGCLQVGDETFSSINDNSDWGCGSPTGLKGGANRNMLLQPNGRRRLTQDQYSVGSNPSKSMFLRKWGIVRGLTLHLNLELVTQEIARKSLTKFNKNLKMAKAFSLLPDSFQARLGNALSPSKNVHLMRALYQCVPAGETSRFYFRGGTSRLTRLSRGRQRGQHPSGVFQGV